MLSISVERAEIVDAAGLEAMLPDIDALQLELPDDVIDTHGGGGLISTSGRPQTFTAGELTTILAAIDDDAEVDVSHANDVAVWEALAQLAPIAGAARAGAARRVRSADPAPDRSASWSSGCGRAR